MAEEKYIDIEQCRRLDDLVEAFKEDSDEYKDLRVPQSKEEKRRILLSLMNIRMPKKMRPDIIKIQDEYLKGRAEEKGIVTLSEIGEIKPGISIWQGDITRLKVGAIVNAANSGMTGCYQPCHSCIDNCIHTYAGIQLRNYCQKMMDEQGYEEPTGQAKITPAFNLPCDYVIHTVGPIVQGTLTKEHEKLLASCYENCLSIADENGVKSIAFCCISTGVFMFPNERAAQIAVQTVRKYKKENKSGSKVIFNVFKDEFFILNSILNRRSNLRK